MQLSINNLDKPSKKSWKRIADFLLYTLPVYLTLIMAAPISDEMKLWLNFGFSIIIVTIKGITKFTAEDE